jgi:hypothetical protein
MKGMNLSIIYLIYCKNICKCYNVAPFSTTIKKEKKIVPRTLHSITKEDFIP